MRSEWSARNVPGNVEFTRTDTVDTGGFKSTESKKFVLPNSEIVACEDDVYKLRYANEVSGDDFMVPVYTSNNDDITVRCMRATVSRIAETMRNATDRSYYKQLIRAFDKSCLGDLVRMVLEDDNAKHADDRVYRLIEEADKCRDQIVLCLMGNPGIGKTEAVERFAKDHGRKVVHIIASQILPSEVSGMTMPNQETHTMDVFDHVRLGHMRDGDILFLDELLKGQQQVLNACLTLVQERRLMSGRKLPDIMIIAAANPLHSPGQLPLEIRQRFMFVDIKWDKRSWLRYMRGLGFGGGSLNGLANHLEGIQKKSDVKSDSAAWNILTPRSATKLCLWLRATGSSEVVLSYMDQNFDPSVSKMIRDVVEERPDGTPKRQVASKIIDLVTTSSFLYKADSPEHLNDMRKKIIEDAEEMRDDDANNMSSLVEMLQKLPEWEQIKLELASTMMDGETMDIEY